MEVLGDVVPWFQELDVPQEVFRLKVWKYWQTRMDAKEYQ